MTTSNTEVFLASLDRCDRNEAFVADFYRRFLESNAEVRIKFMQTDFTHQVGMMRRSLALSAAAAAGEREGLNELLMRARSHDRSHLDIPPHLYALWQEALIETARARDPQWDDDVERAWRTITGFMVEFMTSRY